MTRRPRVRTESGQVSVASRTTLRVTTPRDEAMLLREIKANLTPAAEQLLAAGELTDAMLLAAHHGALDWLARREPRQ